jgi:hypothetical protein
MLKQSFSKMKRVLIIFLPILLAVPLTVTKEEKMKILMVLTSHGQLGNTGHKTGF